MRSASEMWQLISSVVVLLGPVLVIIYDIIAARFGGRESTISAVIAYWASRFPELPAIAAGVFVWLWLHLFWQGMMDGLNHRHPPEPPPTITNGVNGVKKG